jgi:hypothetical protein
VLTRDNGHVSNPFWAISAEPEVIRDHNDFYTPEFLGFLHNLYDEILSEPPPSTEHVTKDPPVKKGK